MQYELVTLKNHIKTIFVHSPGRTAGSIQIWFNAGSALEGEKNWGIAHFLEHMFFKGTPTRPGAVLADDVESKGGEFNAFTSFDYTCYYINMPNIHLTKAADILMDMVSNPTFKQEDLVPEREVVLEEYKRSLDSPQQLAFLKLQESCFTGGYAHPILGSDQHITNFSREQLIEFREKFYNADNCTLVVAGDLEHKEEIIKTIESYDMPRGHQASFPAFTLTKKPQISTHNKETRMAQLYMSISAPNFNKDEAVLEDLAMNCLGHGETSHLYKNLVAEHTYANSVDASTMFMRDGGIHFISLSLPPENLKIVLNKMEACLKNMMGKITKKELEKIKNQYIASKVFEKESLESYAFSLGHNLTLTGDLDADNKFLEKIRNATLAEVNNALATIFHRAIHFSLQLPSDFVDKDSSKLLEQFREKISKLKFKPQKEVKSTDLQSKFDPSLKMITLKDGIQLLYKQSTTSPTFVLHAYIKSGLSLENKKNNGIHNLIGRSITKGYGNVSFESLKEELENKSIHLTGFAGKNAYGLIVHAQSQHQEVSFDHALGSLLKPNFRSKILNQEKELILRTLENQKENPTHALFERASQNHFKGHSYAMPIMGTVETLKSFKQKTLTEYHQKNLRTKDILITYCGDRPLEEVKNLIEKNIASLKKRKSSGFKKKELKSVLGETLHIPFDREQVHILVSTQAAGFSHKDYLYLKILTAHLSGQSSELFVEMRDKKGLCYTAQPVHFSALEAGYWGIYMASSTEKVPTALEEIKKLITKYGDNGLDKEQFEKIKAMIEGRELLSLQTNDDYANTLSVPALHGLGVDHYFKTNQNIHDLDHEQFQKGLKRILKRKWNTITVGNES